MQCGDTLRLSLHRSALTDTSFISKHLFLNTDLNFLFLFPLASIYGTYFLLISF